MCKRKPGLWGYFAGLTWWRTRPERGNCNKLRQAKLVKAKVPIGAMVDGICTALICGEIEVYRKNCVKLQAPSFFV
jgi:hypothetical protein